MGCYKACSIRGIKCPQDVSITGYNDVGYSALISPGLTTVRVRSYKAGTVLADILIERIENPDLQPVQTTVDPELVIRGSTGPARY